MLYFPLLDSSTNLSGHRTMPDDQSQSPSLEQGGLARRIVQGILYLGVAQYGVLAIGLIKTPILARLVLPEVHGIVGMANAWVAFLNFFRMELREVVISDQTRDEVRLSVQYLVETAMAAVGIVLSLALRLAWPGLVSTAVWQAIFTILGVQFFFAVTSTPLYILHRDIRQKVLTRLTLTGALISLVVSAAVAFMGYPLLSLLLDAAIPTVVTGIGAWIVVGWRPSLRWDKQIAKDVFSFGVTMWTGGIFSKISFEFDDWLVGNINGETPLAYYQKAYTLAKMPMDVFAGLIGGIALSMYAQSHVVGKAVLERVYEMTTWLLMRIIAVSSIVMLAAADEIVLIMLGPNWLPVPVLLWLMFLYVLGRPLFQNNAQLLISIRQERLYRRSIAVQAIFLLIACPPAVLLWGAKGASVAVSVMGVIGFLLSNWYVARQIDVRFLPIYLLPLALTVILSPLAYLAGSLVDGVLVSFLLKSAVGGLIFCAVTWLFERERLLEVVKLVADQLAKKSEAPAE